MACRSGRVSACAEDSEGNAEGLGIMGSHTDYKRLFELTEREERLLKLRRNGISCRNIAAIFGLDYKDVSCAISRASEKERALKLDPKPKSHAPSKIKAAHGNRLDPFIK